MGYVTHRQTKSLGKSFLIAIGPLLINTVLCAIITLPAVIPSFYLKSDIGVLQWLLLWIGLAIGIHAFPSDHDVENVIQCMQSIGSSSVLLLMTRIMRFVLQLAHNAGIFLSTLYAIMVALVLPTVAIRLLAGI